MADCQPDVGPEYRIPDALWAQIKPLLLPPKPKKKPGRPRMDDRKPMTASSTCCALGCQWKAPPRTLGAPSTVHDRFQEWRAAGVFAPCGKLRSWSMTN